MSLKIERFDRDVLRTLGLYIEETYSENLEDFIISFIKKNGSVTRSEVEEVTGSKKSRVSEVLKSLNDQGIIEKIGKARGTKYKLSGE